MALLRLKCFETQMYLFNVFILMTANWRPEFWGWFLGPCPPLHDRKARVMVQLKSYQSAWLLNKPCLNEVEWKNLPLKVLLAP